MAIERESVLRRVSKMFALASNNPSEHEAQVAAKMAQDLMLGEAITMADVAKWENENGVRATKLAAGDIVYHCDTGSSRTASWRASLGWAVATNLGGTCVRTPSSGVKARGTYKLGKLTFVGLNVEAILEVFRYLELQLDSLSVSDMRDRPDVERFNYTTYQYETVRPNARYWRLSFLVGAVERLQELLKEQYEKVEETNGTELVLVRDLVKERVNELFGRLKYSTSRQKVYDGNAFERGRSAANTVDIGRTKLGGAPAQLNA